jgi:hypothetical protein
MHGASRGNSPGQQLKASDECDALTPYTSLKISGSPCKSWDYTLIYIRLIRDSFDTGCPDEGTCLVEQTRLEITLRNGRNALKH